VTKRALFQRINRALEKGGEQLKTSRGMQMYLDVGAYYAIDISRNFISRKDIDLEEFGRELGVLKPHEELSPEA